MDRRYQSGWWLEVEYWEEELTQREIADLCDVSPTTIRNWMKRYSVPRRDVEGEDHPLYGEERSEDVRRRISETLEGRDVSREWRERMSEARSGERLPDDVRDRISESLSGITRSEETRRKMSESTAGERNPNWRGGYSRHYGGGWSLARDRVRERDEVCRHCGHDGTERRLEVHHIVPVRLFREATNVRLADAHVDRNLVLLCRRCHVRADHGQIEFDLMPIFEAVFAEGDERERMPPFRWD